MIGQALNRVDGPLKVAGRATYAYEQWGPPASLRVHRRRDDRQRQHHPDRHRERRTRTRRKDGDDPSQCPRAGCP